jgi:hypothetical protein
MRPKLRSAKRRELVRGTIDLMVAMALFWAISLHAAVHPGRTIVLLSIAVASMAAFNLAFLRHLRRAYASPRRGVWRRA